MNASEWKNISFIVGDRLLNIYIRQQIDVTALLRRRLLY